MAMKKKRQCDRLILEKIFILSSSVTVVIKDLSHFYRRAIQFRKCEEHSKENETDKLTASHA